MSDNIGDFEAAASDISERAVVIRDQQLVLRIGKWLTRLTASENRDHNDFEYLKLLQYMVVNRRIGPPFHQNPPAGPLLPLSRYLLYSQQPACDGPPPNWCRNRDKCCRVINRSGGGGGGGSTESGSAYEGANGEKDIAICTVTKNDDDDDINGSQTSDIENGALRGAVLTANDENNSHSRNEENSNRKCSAKDYEDASSPKGKRDELHLAGGGGGECGPCSAGARRAPQTKPVPGKVCDPCLDSMGRHLKKPRPKPIDVAYRDLLGDCAFPVLTEIEQKSTNPGLLLVLNAVNDQTTLQDFYFQVSQYTCDQALLMIRLSDGMVDDFRAFASDVFESRTEHISDGLAKEQAVLDAKYAYLAHRMFNRATIALDFLREAVPLFSWSKYWLDPNAYLKRLILATVPPVDEQQDGGGNGDDGVSGGGGGGGHGQDESEEGAQQSSVKKLLYALNWLRAEVTRADCEAQLLFERRNQLTTSLADHNGQLSTAQCRSAGDIDRLKNELTLLRKQSADQTANIDRLMEAVQVAMQSHSKTADC